MDKEQYLIEIENDCTEFINENYEDYGDFEDLWDDMRNDVSGNYSGSYYCSTARAKEAVTDILWDPEVVDMCDSYGFDGIPTEKGPEACDVIIRFVLMDELYGELEDLYNELREEEEEEDGD